MRPKIVITLLIKLVVCSSIIAQQVTFFTTYDGLIDNQVFTIFEDNHNDLWFGTAGGLGKWVSEKNSWVEYTQANSPLVNNKVNAILRDDTGSLWLGTNSGLNVFDGESWKDYTQLKLPARLGSIHITCLFLDTKNNLWIGTKGSGVIKRFQDKEDFKWENYNSTNSIITSDDITAINEDSLGHIWLGTLESGIFKFDNGSWNADNEVPDVGSKINVIFKDHQDQLWFGTSNGVFGTYDGSHWTSCKLIPIVRSIAEDREGNLWFGTETDGVYKYNRISCFKTQIKELEGVPTIWSIIRDHNGYLWLGTNGQGIVRIHLNWQTLDDLISISIKNDITAIAEDKVGNLWLGTRLDGIVKFDGINLEIFNVADHLLGSNSINSIMVDRENRIWCATENGVHQFDGKETWISYYDQLPHQIVNNVIQDQNGVFWFGTWGGVCRFDGESWTTLRDNFFDTIITTIFEDHLGDIWFGTSKNGVYQFDGDSIIAVYNTANGLIDNQVTSIIQDKDFAYWFGTPKGISQFNGRDWIHFTRENSGLPHNNVWRLFKDRNNHIWVGTLGGGLGKFDGQSWVNFSVEQTRSNQINAIFQDSHGNFWFGTAAGLVKYFPDKTPPETIITYKPHQIIGLASTLFTFTGTDIETPDEKLLYSWALQNNQAGSMNNWSNFIDRTYCEIHCPFNGTFTFLVKAKDESGNEDQSPASYRFTVDTSAPITIINSPASNEIISGKVPVLGTACDDTAIINDFKHYWLDYAEGKSIELIQESDWKLINDTLATSVLNDTLTVWDTSELYGSVFLRLSACDTLDHLRHFIVRVDIVETLAEISNLQGGTIKSLGDRIQLLVPPNSLKRDLLVHITPVMVSRDTLPLIEHIKYSNMAYYIGPDSVTFQKPVTLTFRYDAVDVSELNESNLAILCLDDSNVYGGFIDPEKHIIRTTIKNLGTYIMVEDNMTKTGNEAILNMNCQPRVFSPAKTGYTNISFNLTSDSEISIKIYNLAGRLVRCLFEKTTMRAGNKSIEWDGRNYHGDICPSDLYLVTIENETGVKTKTVMILDK